MQLIADILLGAGALGAAIYCIVLSRRLAALTRLETGMGGAIAVLSAQVDEMTKALERARAAAGESASALEGRVTRAEAAAERLDIVLAALHDLPEAPPSRTEPERRLRVVRHRGRSAAAEAAE